MAVEIERRDALKASLLAWLTPRSVAKTIAASALTPVVENNAVLTPAMRSAGSKMVELIDAQRELESFLEQLGGMSGPPWKRDVKKFPYVPGFEYFALDDNEAYLKAALPAFYEHIRGHFKELATQWHNFYVQQEGREQLREDIKTINALPDLEARILEDMGDLEFRVGKFYSKEILALHRGSEYFGPKDDVTREMLSAINSLLGNHLQEQITLENMDSEEIPKRLTAAIQKKYPDEKDKLKAFVADIRKLFPHYILQYISIPDLRPDTNTFIRTGQEQYLQTLRSEKARLVKKFKARSFKELVEFAQNYAGFSGELGEKGDEDRMADYLKAQVKKAFESEIESDLGQSGKEEYKHEALHQLTDAILFDAGVELPNINQLYADGYDITRRISQYRIPTPNFLTRHRMQTERYLERINTIPLRDLISKNVFSSTKECCDFLSDPKHQRALDQCVPLYHDMNYWEQNMYAVAMAERAGIKLPQEIIDKLNREAAQFVAATKKPDPKIMAEALADRFFHIPLDGIADAADTIGKYALRMYLAKLLAENASPESDASATEMTTEVSITPAPQELQHTEEVNPITHEIAPVPRATVARALERGVGSFTERANEEKGDFTLSP